MVWSWTHAWKAPHQILMEKSGQKRHQSCYTTTNTKNTTKQIVEVQHPARYPHEKLCSRHTVHQCQNLCLTLHLLTWILLYLKHLLKKLHSSHITITPQDSVLHLICTSQILWKMLSCVWHQGLRYDFIQMPHASDRLFLVWRTRSCNDLPIKVCLMLTTELFITGFKTTVSVNHFELIWFVTFFAISYLIILINSICILNCSLATVTEPSHPFWDNLFTQKMGYVKVNMNQRCLPMVAIECSLIQLFNHKLCY